MTIDEITLSQIIEKYQNEEFNNFDNSGNFLEEVIYLNFNDYKKLIELAKLGVRNEKTRNS